MKTRLYYLLILTTILMVSLTISCERKSIPQQESPQPSLSNEADTTTNDSSVSGSLTFTDYDTPPSPVENPMPAYPPKLRSSGIQGVVVLDVEVLETGTVGNVTVKKSLVQGEGGLDETAISAVKSWIFKPAMKKNRPVKAQVNVPIPFTLK